MGARFVSVDRNTPILLPPDLRDCAPEDDQELPEEIAHCEKLASKMMQEGKEDWQEMHQRRA